MVQPGMGQNGPAGSYNNQNSLPSPNNNDEYHEKLKQLRKYIEPMSRVSSKNHNFLQKKSLFITSLNNVLLDYREKRTRSKSQSQFAKHSRNDTIQTRNNKNEIAKRYYFRKPSSYSSNSLQM